MVVLVPAGMEGYYAELGVPTNDPDRGGAAAPGQDLERLATVAARYGVEITGPAPGPRDEEWGARIADAAPRAKGGDA